MAEKQKSFGKKLKDLFIVEEGGQSTEAAEAGEDPPRPAATGSGDVDDLIARYASADAGRPAGRSTVAPSAGSTAPPSAAASPSAAAPASAAARVTAPLPVAAAAGMAATVVLDPNVQPAKVNFAEVYQKGGVSSEEQGRVERALALLNNLPKDTPKEVKRQIVEASLVAFGIPVDQIIEAALLHQRALDRHVEKGQLETQQLIDESNQRLKDLEKQMADIRQRMQERFHNQQGLAAACGQQRFTVQEVLDFFGQEAVDRVGQLSVKLRSGGPTPPEARPPAASAEAPQGPAGGRRR